MLSVCCINFSTVASNTEGTEEGPIAELTQRNHAIAKLLLICLFAHPLLFVHAHSKISSSV